MRAVSMKFIAHRGYSHRHPENSLEAFQAVIEHPCNGSSLIGIELDVHLTADDVIPVMHEVDIRSESGTMIPVSECSFDRLQRLHSLQYNGKRPAIPDIHSVLSLIKHRTSLCFEIKIGTYDLDRFAGVFKEALTDYRPKGDVIISSFSHQIIEHLRPHFGQFDIQYGFIFNNHAVYSLLSRSGGAFFDFLHPWYKLLFSHKRLFKKAGIPIRCWTVNDRPTVSSLIELSHTLPIDAIMTDDITLAEPPPGN
jgi:glycerophosphoryl diester phosphodiesterase